MILKWVDFRDTMLKWVARHPFTFRHSGWAEYQDTQYTSESPFALSADEDVILPNNGGVTREEHQPSDIPHFYVASTRTIPGRDGDGINIFSYFQVSAETASGGYMDWWIDIGNPVGVLYRRTITFPKGNSVSHGASVSIAGFSLNTWESNGAKIYVRANTPVTIWDITLVLTRTHRAA